MPQTYHANATTNVHIRSDIRKSDMQNAELARRYGVSENTVSKWRNRECQEDASSRPHNIQYAIAEVTEALIVPIRKSLWNSREDISDMVLEATGIVMTITTVYRCLVRNNINRKPKAMREAYFKFKEYAPGYLHIDVTYLPRIDGERKYLFVAIDRATRLMFYLVYDGKTAENAADFLARCRDFFPFEIRTILTDNGKEFSNRLLQGQVRCHHRQGRSFRPGLRRGDRAPAHKAGHPEDQRNGGTRQPHHQECHYPPPSIHLSRRTICVACRLPPALQPPPKTWKPGQGNECTNTYR